MEEIVVVLLTLLAAEFAVLALASFGWTLAIVYKIVRGKLK